MDKINLNIDNIREGTNRKITIYCRYWLINRSMLPLSFQTPIESKKKTPKKGKDEISTTSRRSRLRSNSETGVASEIFSGILEAEVGDNNDDEEKRMIVIANIVLTLIQKIRPIHLKRRNQHYILLLIG